MDSVVSIHSPWIFANFNSWIQAPQENEAAMNSISRIKVQTFGLLTVAAILKAAEFGIERQETFYPGLSAERMEGT